MRTNREPHTGRRGRRLRPVLVVVASLLAAGVLATTAFARWLSFGQSLVVDQSTLTLCRDGATLSLADTDPALPGDTAPHLYGLTVRHAAAGQASSTSPILLQRLAASRLSLPRMPVAIKIDDVATTQETHSATVTLLWPAPVAVGESIGLTFSERNSTATPSISAPDPAFDPRVQDCLVVTPPPPAPPAPAPPPPPPPPSPPAPPASATLRLRVMPGLVRRRALPRVVQIVLLSDRASGIDATALADEHGVRVTFAGSRAPVTTRRHRDANGDGRSDLVLTVVTAGLRSHCGRIAVRVLGARSGATAISARGSIMVACPVRPKAPR